MRASWISRGAAIAAVVAFASGCNPAAKRVSDHFLESVSREDWAAAYADLHPEARANTPSADALRARFESAGDKLVSWFGNCGNGGELARIGYNVTSTTRRPGAAPVRPMVVGVPPLRRGKCNGPLLVELAEDTSVPERPWRIRSVQWN